MRMLRRRLSGIVLCLTLWAGSCIGQVNAGAAPNARSTPPIHAVQRLAGTYFYLQADSVSSHETLMARKRTEAAGRKLLDLEILTPGKRQSSFEIQPSWDGKYVAVGFSLGREGYSIRVVDVAAATLLPESIVHSFDGDAAWSDNNNAFFYRKFQPAAIGAPADAIFTNMRAYRHKLGEDPSTDDPVFGPGINPELYLPAVGAVNAFPLHGSSLLLGVQSSAPSELDSFWVHDGTEPGRGWRQIIDHTDEVLFELSSRENTLYFITRRNAPGGRLMELDASREDISSAREILPPSDLQLADRNRDGVVCAKDALYVYGRRKGVSALVRVPYEVPARSVEIALPFVAVVTDVSGDSLTSGLLSSLVGDSHPMTVYEYDPSGDRVVDTKLTSSSDNRSR